MAEEPEPEADRVAGLPHPRESAALFGQESAEAAFLSAWGSGRLHHAWLLTGPRGIGKATLAYRIARKRLAEAGAAGLFGAPEPPRTLTLDPEDPISRRVAAGSEPRLFTLRREADEKTGRVSSEILVKHVRRLKGFFQLSAADGGWRVAVVDAAEEMNASAANALLKLLEEPPPRTLLLLVCHAPARLLPTIRSRCITLKLALLCPEDLAAVLGAAGVETGGAAEARALALLSGGSAGEAARLAALGGPALYARLLRLFAGAPGMDRREMTALGAACAGRDNAETYDLALRMLARLFSRLARAGALGPPAEEAAPREREALAGLSPSPEAARLWADHALRIGGRAAQARAVNLDPQHVMLDIFLETDAVARHARARRA